MSDPANLKDQSSTNENIAYKTDQLARYFAQHRVSWEQFYESERVIIEQLHLERDCSVLDVGCGCGGLGVALRDRYGVDNYTGVEINQLAANAGRMMNPHANILCGDVLDLSRSTLRDKRYNVVFSLSCVDWNIRFDDMLAASWDHVLPGGHLVATFRLTVEEGCKDIQRSYQYINYDGNLEGERASYVVLNAKILFGALVSFDPSEIMAYGYWGTPSPTAVTPYERLCFAAFAIGKRKSGDVATFRSQLNLPMEILDTLKPAG
jgi:precorrin-6B methylase 2